MFGQKVKVFGTVDTRNTTVKAESKEQQQCFYISVLLYGTFDTVLYYCPADSQNHNLIIQLIRLHNPKKMNTQMFSSLIDM